MITFYSMQGCGHCVNAKSQLAQDISSGLVTVKDASESPPGVRGFPHFVNEQNGKTSTGFGSRSKLLSELGISSEGYHREYSGVNVGSSYGSAEFFRHAPVSNNVGYRTLESYNAPQRLTDNNDIPYGMGGCRVRRG